MLVRLILDALAEALLPREGALHVVMVQAAVVAPMRVGSLELCILDHLVVHLGPVISAMQHVWNNWIVLLEG